MDGSDGYDSGDRASPPLDRDAVTLELLIEQWCYSTGNSAQREVAILAKAPDHVSGLIQRADDEAPAGPATDRQGGVAGPVASKNRGNSWSTVSTSACSKPVTADIEAMREARLQTACSAPCLEGGLWPATE